MTQRKNYEDSQTFIQRIVNTQRFVSAMFLQSQQATFNIRETHSTSPGPRIGALPTSILVSGPITYLPNTEIQHLSSPILTCEIKCDLLNNVVQQMAWIVATLFRKFTNQHIPHNNICVYAFRENQSDKVMLRNLHRLVKFFTRRERNHPNFSKIGLS